MGKTRVTPSSLLVTASPEATEQLGEQLGRLLKPGDVVALIGELGTGKTTFVRGLAAGLGLDPDLVKSPTFVLLREYPGRLPLIHIDGYRLDSAQAVVWEDVDWVFSPKKVTAIEWADRMADSLPEDYVEIQFIHTSAKKRTLALIPHGSRAQTLIEPLRTSAAD